MINFYSMNSKMNNKTLRYIIFLIVFFILILLLSTCWKNTEPFSDTLASYKTPTQAKNVNLRTPPWFHGLIDKDDNNYMYNYNYLYSQFEERDRINLLLAFFCVKTVGIFQNSWTAEHDNVLEMMRSKIPCKTSVVYDLRTEAQKRSKGGYTKATPANHMLIQRVLEDDINNSMKEYKKIGGGKLLAPVYCIMIQYPNKLYTYQDGTQDYKYSHFDLNEEDLIPYQRRDVRKLNKPDVKDKEGQVDTKIMFIYPMYAKNTVKFYRPPGTKYTHEKSGCNDITKKHTKECIDQYPEYRFDVSSINNFKQAPDSGEVSIQGIVDMIKFFSGSENDKNLQLDITKAQQCFIKCNNDGTTVCGCGTKLHSDDYKSYCKDRYDIDEPDTKNKLSSYAFVYRINELKSDLNVITDINMNSDTEKRISLLVNYSIGNLEYTEYENTVPTSAQIKKKLKLA